LDGFVSRRTIQSIEDVKARPHEAFQQLTKEREKSQLELIRYRQDCRKRAIEYGIDAENRTGNVFTIEGSKKKADEYYEWLIKGLS
jgi:hypothetical protein